MTAGNEIVLPVRRPVTSTVTSHLGPMPAAASRACAALRSLARPLARRWLYSHRRTVSGNTAYHPLAPPAITNHPCPDLTAQEAKVPSGVVASPRTAAAGQAVSHGRPSP